MPIAEIGAAVVEAAKVTAEVAAKAANAAEKTAEVSGKLIDSSAEIVGKTPGIKGSEKATLGQAQEYLNSKIKPFDEISNAKGGRYGDLKNDIDPETKTNKTEKHHMPPKNASRLDIDDGPAIKMDKEDHKKTASWGNSKEAREYNAKQKDLIDHGKFREALQNDIDDIRSKFGDKYDGAISQMLEYVDKLEAEGMI